MPNRKSLSDIRATILRPAMTSQFMMYVDFPSEVKSHMSSRGLADPQGGVLRGGLNLACSEASLPGSSLATLEQTSDRTGVTERHVHRRMFDDRIDLTFYVDAQNYMAIRFFEGWISYIMNEDQNANPFSDGDGPVQETTPSLASRDYHYRVKYPNDYIADQGLKVIKFERDYQQQLTYEFIRSFPLSISSMPVSFDSSSLLKVTVSMSYIRYIVLKSPSVTRPQGGFNPFNLLNPSSQADFNGRQFLDIFRNNLPLGANDLLRSAQIT